MNDNKMAQYFTYLDFLRELGVTNMLGASPYLMHQFDIPKAEARNVLLAWMDFKEKASMAQK